MKLYKSDIPSIIISKECLFFLKNFAKKQDFHNVGEEEEFSTSIRYSEVFSEIISYYCEYSDYCSFD